jgi:SAM-dependent methyltransferase
MPLKPPTTFPRPVRQTLRWLVPDADVQAPLESVAESRYCLCHAQRLHDSLTRLPAANGNARCLVVGSWGIEVPYLAGRLGWRDITCICAPAGRSSRSGSRRRDHPNGEGRYAFDLLEHDIEARPLPFEDESFGLVVYWGCLEHLRCDPEFSLYELNRVAAPGATLSLVTDNAISFQATHSLLRGHPMPMRLHWPSAEGHWRLYTPTELEELLNGTGWRTDTLTTIVPDPPVYWKWWKRWLFRRLVAGLRKGFGLSDPSWNAFILALATKVSPPTRSYPTWLYKDEKIRQLKMEMLELVSRRRPPRAAAAVS